MQCIKKPCTIALLGLGLGATALWPATASAQLTSQSPSTQQESAEPKSPVPETKPAIDLDRKAKESPVAAAARKDLVGLAVFGSDGQKVGDVQAVKVEAGGPIQEIHVRTGGFLGFGGRMVAIPAGKFSKSGQSVQLAMTSTEVKALPDLKARAS